MLEYIREDNVWNTIKESGKPVILYGMGLGAEKIMDTLSEYGISVDGIFASDDFVRGHSFRGFKVMKYSEVCEKFKDFNVILCFATHIDGVIENIKRINEEHTVFAPDVPVAGGGLFSREFVERNEEEFDKVYNALSDDESKKVYVDIINFKISGKTEYLLNTYTEKPKIYKDILKLTKNENILDLGAYDGDTVSEFLEATDGEYNYITALEPDEKNFKKLLKNTEDLDNISCLNLGAWDKNETLIFSKKAGRNSKLSADGVSVDVIAPDSLELPATFIKMDIEGAELKALCGLEKTIKKYSPKLYICAYHRNEDLFTLPLKILEYDKDYKIYFRHSKYIPAWESNFYCIKE